MSCCDSSAPQSNMGGTVHETPAGANTTGTGFEVRGAENLHYTFSFVDSVFDPAKADLASYYTRWGRALVIMDNIVHSFYGDAVRKYFAAHGITPTIHTFRGGELNKNMDTMLGFVDAMDAFGLIRTEPVLVVGGGLAGDVAGYACASYRRSSNYIRVATTLIANIDSSVSIKVGLNHGKLKNRLGAYHAPLHTFLDFEFLKTLPVGQTRNGFAELIKIAHVADKQTWDLMVKYGPRLVETAFGRSLPAGSSAEADELRAAGDAICRRAIHRMLQLESGNLREIGLDRVIACGHGISPTLELAPYPPLRHGHAITVDMAYTCTQSFLRGYISAQERDQWYDLAVAVGLTVDHPALDEALLLRSVDAIKKTRDGKQRFVLAKPLGQCVFANDISDDELKQVLHEHRAYVAKRYPHTNGGAGIDAYADAGDLGEEIKGAEPQHKRLDNGANGAARKTNGHAAHAKPIEKLVPEPHAAAIAA